MVPMYILGLLERFGPQHGYQIRKIIDGQLADFTQIKLPTIYYHLERMEEEGLLSATRERPGGRPEKTVYAATDKGREAFAQMLAGLLAFEYRPVFASDAVFYFSDALDTADIAAHLKTYIEMLRRSAASIEIHRADTLGAVPPEMAAMAGIIFSHHLHHFEAELNWALESLQQLKGDEDHDQTQSD